MVPATPYPPLMKLTLDAIGLVVTDMAATLAFYRRLGLHIPEEADSTTHVEVALTGGLRLTFDTTELMTSFDSSYGPGPWPGGGSSLAFVAQSPEAVDEAYADLVTAGYQGHLPPWDAFWGHRYAVVHDPDGRTVDLFAPLST